MDRYSVGEFLVSSSLLSYHGLSLLFSLSPFVVASGVERVFGELKGVGLFPVGFCPYF